VSVTLIDAAAELAKKPYAFVKFAWNWGEGELQGEPGPDIWQKGVLKHLEAQIDAKVSPIRLAVKSGHGVGKSALIAWLINWFICTRPNPQVVCTANTRLQIETKTWREVAKWHKLSLFRDWNEWTATSFYNREHPETWRASAIPWSKDRSEAFAGTHAKHVLVLFDEASVIDDMIWDVVEGAMTTRGAIWIVFGNPTRNTGRFRECWGKQRHRWTGTTVDSRTAKHADQGLIKQWIEDYGLDSDFVKVRALGQFPSASDMQFIPTDLAEAAMGRQIEEHAIRHAPRVLGVDVARFGTDQTVFVVRQGLAVKHMDKIRQRDTMAVASLAGQICREWKCQAVFVDDTGVGGGVTDRLNQLQYNVIPVVVGEKAEQPDKYFNHRAEIWDRMKQALKVGLCLPKDDGLRDALIGVEYGFDAKERLQLETKLGMKSRGLSSPDEADALALTYSRLFHRDDDEESYEEHTSAVDDSGGLFWADKRR
jgi:hypothetical protein